MEVNYPLVIGILLMVTFAVLIAYFVITRQYRQNAKKAEYIENAVIQNASDEIVKENLDQASDVLKQVKTTASIAKLREIVMAQAVADVQKEKKKSKRRIKRKKR